MIDVAITDVCDFQGGTQPPKNMWSKTKKLGHIRMLQIRDFTQRKNKHIEYIEDKKTLKKCNSNDILIGRYGASIGKILTGLSGAYNVAIVKTIPDKEKIYRGFLLHLLKGNEFQRFIQNVGSRAAQAGFNKQELTKFRFNLPSLSEQKKIAEILDAADSLRQKDQQLIEHYNTLSQSLFLDMFGDVFANDKAFEKVQLNELLVKVQIGPFGSQLHKHDYIEGGIPLVNPIHIKNSKIVPNTNFTLSKEKFESLPNYHLKTGDLIMGRRGEMGRCALVTNKEHNYFCGTGSLYLRPTNKVNSVFLLHVISSQSGKSYLERNAQGVTMMNLNKKIIQNIVIGVPSIEMQNEFAISMESIETQKHQAKLGLKKSEELFNSLLQRAFKGELTN